MNVYKGLKREVLFLAAFRLVSGVGFFVIPYLSLFLTQELKLKSVTAGVIISLANALCVPTLFIGGKLIEKFKSRDTIVSTQVISALFYLGVVLAPTNSLKVVSAIIGFCLASMAVPAMDKYVSLNTTIETRRSAFSLLYLCQNIGVAIGSLIIGSIYDSNPYIVFIGDALTTLAALSLFYLATIHQGEESTVVEEKVENDSAQRLKTPWFLNLFMGTILINTLCYRQLSFMLPIFLKEVTGDGAMLFGVVMTVNAVICIAFSPLCTAAFKKYKTIIPLIVSEAMFAIGYFIYSLPMNKPLIFGGTVMWSFAEVLFSINYMTFIIENADVSQVGFLSAKANSFNRVGAILSAFVGGTLLSLAGAASGWRIVSGLMLVSVMICVYLNFYTKGCKKAVSTDADINIVEDENKSAEEAI